MMGSKKLSEIKQELRQALGNDKELTAWLDRRISRPSTKTAGVPTVEKDLLWVRDLLREAVVVTKPHQRGTKRSKPKRTSAAR